MKPYLLLLFCFLNLSLSAQTTPGISYEVKGITADSLTSKTLDYITIGLKTDKNIPVKSTLSKSDGSFLFSGIKPGKYLIAVIAVGYRAKTLTVDLTGEPLVKELGTILINGPNLALQETSNSYMGTSFSVNKNIVKDKLSVSASANNPFRKYRTNIRESFGPDFFQTSNNQAFYRTFNTSLNYKFGKLKSAIRKNSRGIRNDDVSNNAAQ